MTVHVEGMALVRCPGPCGKWRVRVARPFGAFATRRHKPCGMVPVTPSTPVRDTAAPAPGSATGSERRRRGHGASEGDPDL